MRKKNESSDQYFGYYGSMYKTHMDIKRKKGKKEETNTAIIFQNPESLRINK